MARVSGDFPITSLKSYHKSVAGLGPVGITVAFLAYKCASKGFDDVKGIRANDNLYDAGLDSLDTVEALMNFEKVYDIGIPDDHLSQESTIRQITAYIKENVTDAEKKSIPNKETVDLLMNI